MSKNKDEIKKIAEHQRRHNTQPVKQTKQSPADQIAAMSARIDQLEREAAARSAPPQGPQARLPEHLRYQSQPQDTDTQRQLLAELKKSNKRAGFSWVRVAALFVVIVIVVLFLFPRILDLVSPPTM